MTTGYIILTIVIIVIFALISGFIWMICLGALAHIFDIPRLAIGFGPSVAVGAISNILLNGIRNRNS